MLSLKVNNVLVKYFESKNAKIQIMGSPTRMCVASDLQSRILEPLLAHQRKAQEEGRGVDLHLQAGDGKTTSLHQVEPFLSVGNFSCLR